MGGFCIGCKHDAILYETSISMNFGIHGSAGTNLQTLNPCIHRHRCVYYICVAYSSEWNSIPLY